MYSMLGLFLVSLAILAPLVWSVPVPPSTSGASFSKHIVVNGVTYILDKELGTGKIGTAYSTLDGKVAKRFDTQQPKILNAYVAEASNTRIVLGPGVYFNSGASKINGKGRTFAWIITPFVAGKKFLECPAFLLQRAKGPQQCMDLLAEKIRPEFERKFIDLQMSSGLVHLDAHQKNTFWDERCETIVKFIDYDQMGEVNGQKYRAKIEKWTGRKSEMSLAQLATMLGRKYYPNLICNPRTTMSDIASSF